MSSVNSFLTSPVNSLKALKFTFFYISLKNDNFDFYFGFYNLFISAFFSSSYE